MEAFYATGVLFFTWPVVALTILIDYVWVALCFGLSLWIVGAQDRWAAFKSRFFAVFVASFGADALLAVLILATIAIAQSNARVAAWLEQPFVGMGGTLTALGCILAVALCGLLKWVLYRNIVLKKLKGLQKTQIQTVSVLLAVLTTPWTFLLPTATVGLWIGEIMIAIGEMTGNASLESIKDLATRIP